MWNQVLVEPVSRDVLVHALAHVLVQALVDITSETGSKT